MTLSIVRVCALGMWRDRAALGLCFAVPVLFFSLFATIFGSSSGNGGMPAVRVILVDLDGSELSARLCRALRADPGLRVFDSEPGLDRDGAAQLVTRRKAPVAVVLRPGFSTRIGLFGPAAAGPAALELVVDSSDPIAPRLVSGLIQRALMSGLPDAILERGMERFTEAAGPLSDAQRDTLAKLRAQLRERAEAPAEPGAQGDPAFGGLIAMDVTDLLATAPSKSPVNAFHAASAAVIFVLFTLVGTAGSLLDDEANGTLDRLLIAGVSVGQLLRGRLLFGSLIGCAQLSLMFLWGAAFFGVELFTPAHLAGFALVTACTAVCAAGFGLVMATACRTRAQLDGSSMIVILTLAAGSGCMFPRFLMPEWLQQAGLVAFPAWALDGYQKVFWYERPLVELWPQLGVLLGLALAFYGLAGVLARRWNP